MKNALHIAFAASIAFTALAGSAQAQYKTQNVGPAPTNIAPPTYVTPTPTPVAGCPYGSVQQITIDAYGRQIVSCIYYQNRPINPVGAIIGGIVGGILHGGH